MPPSHSITFGWDSKPNGTWGCVGLQSGYGADKVNKLRALQIYVRLGPPKPRQKSWILDGRVHVQANAMPIPACLVTRAPTACRETASAHAVCNRGHGNMRQGLDWGMGEGAGHLGGRAWAAPQVGDAVGQAPLHPVHDALRVSFLKTLTSTMVCMLICHSRHGHGSVPPRRAEYEKSVSRL